MLRWIDLYIGICFYIDNFVFFNLAKSICIVIKYEENEMKNFTIETTSFSEQLGLYDFFNVLIYGVTFISGVSLLNESLCRFLWENLSFQKGLGLVLLTYITGMLLQELGSVVDKHFTNLYRGMHQRILKGETDKSFEKEPCNDIIENPVVFDKYRNNARDLLKEFEIDTNDECFENKYINSYIFSISQYYLSVKGKDKKTEKLRALFSMSKTLMSCFFLLAICALGTLIFNIDMSIDVCKNLGLEIHGCEHCVDKIIMIAVFSGISVAFWIRAKRTMRNFLLILLGTYNAVLEADSNENA